GWGWNDPWLFNNWGWGWNSPYWGWGWNDPYFAWGWGWNSWRYNRWGWGGFGWGHPWGGWGYGGYDGWGGYYGHWNRPYYNNYRRNYAYMTGRRGYNNNYVAGSTLLGRSNLASRSNRFRTDSGRSNANRSAMASRTSRTYNNGATARR